jgi:uncharacterized protein (TIGR02453 family)
VAPQDRPVTLPGVPPDATFTGFPARALDFYLGLEADNSKSYWQAHAEVFETAVRAPMAAMLASMPEEYQPFKVFRPYRDVRFSADKTPYKTAHAASSPSAKGVGVRYVQLSSDGVLAAVGLVHPARDQLQRWRDAVADDRTGMRLLSILDELQAAGYDVDGGPEPGLTTAPRGFAKDHPRIVQLRWKGVVGWTRIDDPDVLESAAVRDEVARCWAAAQPLLTWLDDHVGPSDLPRERR